jgi:DNA-binding winged helix-turn-helix (wHTH) protein
MDDSARCGARSPRHDRHQEGLRSRSMRRLFRVLLRQRLLTADGTPIELETRAFDLLLALLEADGSLVSKEQLLARVWPGIVVSEANLKVQVSALRRAFGEDRGFIRTEFGRGYGFTAAIRTTAVRSAYQRPIAQRHQSTQGSFPQCVARRPSHGWAVQHRFSRYFDLALERTPHPAETRLPHCREQE